jgi:hypothetical protein
MCRLQETNRPQMSALKLETSSLAFDFLRRVVNELNGRRFEYVETGLPREQVTATVKQPEVLHVFPEVTREFAGKIKPEWHRCHKLTAVYDLEAYTARDPISGVSIRCISHFDVIHGEMLYRFDAAFS